MVPPSNKGRSARPPLRDGAASPDRSGPAGRSGDAGGAAAPEGDRRVLLGSDGSHAGGFGVAFLLRDTQRALSRLLSARIAEYGVSIGQWYFLRTLWDEDGLTQRELSLRVGMMEPTTVTALNGMEQNGLVRRVRNPHDRRKMNIFLTDRGRALKAQLVPIEAELNRLAVEGISARDAEALERVLRQILKNLSSITT